LPIAFVVLSFSIAQASTRPDESTNTDTLVRVLDPGTASLMGAYIESDFVAPQGIQTKTTQKNAEREAAHGSDAFNEAIIYLRESPRAAALLLRLGSAGQRISIVINHNCNGGQHMVESMNSLIYWDPNCAYHVGKSSTSPALVLMHELVHALHLGEQPQAYLDNGLKRDPLFDNREERNTILYGEVAVAHELGEAIRKDHHENRPFRVNDPTLR
jgi:hypothetical protein